MACKPHAYYPLHLPHTLHVLHVSAHDNIQARITVRSCVRLILVLGLNSSMWVCTCTSLYVPASPSTASAGPGHCHEPIKAVCEHTHMTESCPCVMLSNTSHHPHGLCKEFVPLLMPSAPHIVLHQLALETHPDAVVMLHRCSWCAYVCLIALPHTAPPDGVVTSSPPDSSLPTQEGVRTSKSVSLAEAKSLAQ